MHIVLIDIAIVIGVVVFGSMLSKRLNRGDNDKGGGQ